MRTILDVDIESSFGFKKIPHELCADDACVCYPGYIPDARTWLISATILVCIFCSKTENKWIKIRLKIV
jgi:hypothetical protein